MDSKKIDYIEDTTYTFSRFRKWKNLLFSSTST